MAPPRRRISYIIPPPPDPVPRLQLPPHGAPRHGATGPLLIPAARPPPTPSTPGAPPDADADALPPHPRHRLGVACLALDAATPLVGRAAPEGILYSGGRDGLLVAWDLGLPMRARAARYGVPDTSSGLMQRTGGRWEVMTGWADEALLEEEGEGEEGVSMDGDVLGEVVEGGAGRARAKQSGIERTIPFEERWETDVEAFQPGKPSQFRQCVQAHTDWVNDLLLCNYNQTVISASSDGTIKAWSPHAATPTEPATVGMHADYVRCLSLCREQRWVASGSFDRTVRLWDVTRTHALPLVTLHPPEASGPKASVYALATDPYGAVVASGSPERVVRMWDPRSGKRTGKLVGHTDNIRAILISEDAKYLLTGSADASIKLWSLSTQRCLHTFTHHTDSVWSLFSSHPSLEIFYSGDRSGLVCKVDVEGCTDVSEGECVVVCQDTEPGAGATEGVNKIVAMDDNLLWTATGSSSIRRWRAPPRRAVRAAQLGPASEDTTAEQSPVAADDPAGAPAAFAFPRTRSASPSPPATATALAVTDPAGATTTLALEREGAETWYGLPFASLVRLASAHETFAFGGMAPPRRDPEIATLYSAASVMSVPRLVRAPLQGVFATSAAGAGRSASPGASDTAHRGAEETLHPLRTARLDYEARDVAADAVPLYGAPDALIAGAAGLVRCAVLSDRVHALTVDTAGAVAVWDVVRGACVGCFGAEDVAGASWSGSARSSSVGGDKDRERERERERERSPREALETVRERIEGEAVVVSWSSVDTKTGLLTVHLTERCFEAEIYADEAGYGGDRHLADEMRINIGKWVLRNLFLGFLRELQRSSPRRTREPTAVPEHHRLHRAPAPTHIDIDAADTGAGPQSATMVTSPHMRRAVAPPAPPRALPLAAPLIALSAGALSPIPQSPRSTDPTPGAATGPIPVPVPGGAPRRSATIDHGAPASRENDYFSLRGRRPSVSQTQTPGVGGGVPPSPDEFASWGTMGAPATPSTPSGGGLMGRLRAFGKGGRRQATEYATPGPHPVPDIVTSPSDIVNHSPPKTPLQLLLQGPLTLPSSNELPTVALPPHTALLIAEEAPAGAGWTTLYRGQVSSTGHDLRALEEAMPLWLLEFLLANRIPPIPMVKISFVLLPCPSRGPGDEQLPELLNTAQSKLTASRFLRVRKLTHHVQDKLDKLAAAGSRAHSAATTPRSSLDTRSMSSLPKTSAPHGGARPEEQFEILCHDAVLPLDMTLAAVRQFVWRQSSELTMYYRRKLVPAAGAGTP